MVPTGLAALAVLTAPAASASQRLRIMSLDQCADQHVLALAPDADLFLSPRADDPDSWMRAQAARRPRVRPTLETALTLKPDIVVRSWGGDQRLLQALKARGVRLVQIEDASTLAEVRRNTMRTAVLLDRPEAGRRLIERMDRGLGPVVKRSARRSALYLTSGGFTAGRGTLVGSILERAGYVNAARFSGFGPMSVERLVLEPPSRFVLGFFDQRRADWRGAGRHPVVRAASRGRVVADLPASVLTCPGWFTADAVRMIRQGRSG